MRLPPWAIEAIRNGVADVARKASDPETISKVRDQAAELLRDLPDNASKSIEGIVKSASDRARSALDQGRDSVLRWVSGEVDFGTPCHNTSGVLFSKHGTGVTVPDGVLAAGYNLLRGDCLDHDVRASIDHALDQSLHIDDCCVAVANSFDAAVNALSALSTSSQLADQRQLVLHRSQAIGLPSGTPLPDALEPAQVKECGGVQRIEAGDFDGIENACVILADDGVHEVRSLDFQGRSIRTVAVLPVATLGNAVDSLPDARAVLKSGIDLVVLPGGPVTGGVAAGILAGKESLVQAIVSSRRWKYLMATDAIAAMTLAAMNQKTPTPLSQLISTSEDNLRNRAERMATRLTADDAIAACQITDAPATLSHGARWQFPSRQLRLRHREHSATKWSQTLLEKNPAIVTHVDGEDLVIDLRWLPAGSDPLVAAELESVATDTPSE